VSFVKQASVLNGFAFDPFSFQQDGLPTSEVDVGRRQIVDALVVAQVIVVSDEGFDPSLEFAGPCRSAPRRDPPRQLGALTVLIGVLFLLPGRFSLVRAFRIR
jgi:hypothetical protein